MSEISADELLSSRLTILTCSNFWAVRFPLHTLRVGPELSEKIWVILPASRMKYSGNVSKSRIWLCKEAVRLPVRLSRGFEADWALLLRTRLALCWLASHKEKKNYSAVIVSKEHYGTEVQNKGKLSSRLLYYSTTWWLGTGSTLPFGLKLKHLWVHTFAPFQAFTSSSWLPFHLL